MSNKRQVTDTQVLVVMVETLGTGRTLQLMGAAALAVLGGAQDASEFRLWLQNNQLYSRAAAFELMADLRRVRVALQQAEHGDPGDVWTLMNRLARLRPDLAAWPQIAVDAA